MTDKTEDKTMKCEMCGEEKPDAKECVDPFLREINDEYVERILCYDCYEQRVLDV